MKNSFQKYIDKFGEYGEVTEIHGSLITALGLPSVKPMEIVLLESGIKGQVFSIEKDSVEIVILDKKKPALGEKIALTGELISVPVSENILGNIIDPLGNHIGPGGPTRSSKTSKEMRPLESQIIGITKRASVSKPLHTGLIVVDMMLPLGKGQKQLVIGDRKTGKTSFLLNVIKSQAHEGTLIVYGAIARKQSDIKALIEFLEQEKIKEKVAIVATTSYDSPGLIYLTPYSSMTLAEYFRDQGKEVLVVLDDLTAHAKFYREMSLIGKRFPGRESYPGDIFYTHARLLERSGNFLIDGKKEASITCLPIVETVESDLTGYIQTNVMSMTDGHLLFDQASFTRGRRPAINLPLSVTRVGRQTQSLLKRQINRQVTAYLAEYEKMQTLAHFGAELSGKVQKILERGENMTILFNQVGFDIIPEKAQLILLGLVWSDQIESEDIEDLKTILAQDKHYKSIEKVAEEIVDTDSFDQFLINVGQKKTDIFTTLKFTPKSVELATRETIWETKTESGQVLPGGIPTEARPQEETAPSQSELLASLGVVNKPEKKK